MKKLQKMRLINWHRFYDDTILFGDSTLISGENGAGKSTILDAIQFVVTCSRKDFNKAAHEKGKRTLNTYVRCKTGREDHPYERSGEITCHIALEFYDESKKQPFIVGAVLDSASEEKEPAVAWYLMDKQTLHDEMFLRGNKIKSISEFRATNKQLKNNIYQTQSEAKKMMISRFGRLEDKFFSLIPKALAFRPINNIKDFVYSYVLDKKEVNIDSLRENVRSYQDLERMLEDVKSRIQELEVICNKKAEVDNFLRLIRHEEYYLAQMDVDITKENQQDNIRRQKYERLQEEEERKKHLAYEKEEQMVQETITNLRIELSGNEAYQALSELKKRRESIKKLLVENKKDIRELEHFIQLAMKRANGLLVMEDVDACIRDYLELLNSVQELEHLTDVKVCLDDVVRYKKKMGERVEEYLAKKRIELRDHQESIRGLRHKIEGLEKKRFTYPDEVTILRDSIKKEFEKVGRNKEVRVLCELLEITNSAWQNAVEGYLNTQRFYLLVEPEDFDLALSVYDKLREGKKAYGAGLINTGRLERYDEVPENSLAEVVTSKSIWARRYINMVLGKVTRCQSYQELKKYSIAITRQCMRYQNHVVSAIRPSVYQTPYIGQDAYIRQLEYAKMELDSILEQKGFLENKIKSLESIKKPLDYMDDIEVKHRLDSIEKKREYEGQLKECKETIAKLEKDGNVIQKQMHLDQLEQKATELRNKMAESDQKIGRHMEAVKQEKEDYAILTERLQEEEGTLKELTLRLGDESLLCQKEYEKQIEGKVLLTFRANFLRAKKSNETKKENAEQEMTQFMHGYKIAHDFGAANTMAGYPEFEAEYHKLKDSQLLTYEEKVQSAKTAAEEEFREQFLSRLQENIKQAQSELKELNKALKDIHFSKERYVFSHEPSKKLKKYYEMIMDDFNVMQGQSIFSGLFQQNHREVIEELFEKLAFTDENSYKILEEYTDYRTYMDYDLEIHNENGSFMRYSKVSQEKSGGETQTPFYITVAASFMQLYRNGIGGDSIGLVMLDEAFNNMDDERIAGVLEFMTGSNLQMIIAAPPDKIQYITPSMKKVLLVMSENDVSYVEDFTKI